MKQARLDSKEWSELLDRLGGAEALAASARAHKAFRRRRQVKSASDLLRLCLMYGPGGQSLRMLAASAAALGLAEASDVALLNRIRRAADWLEALCRERLDRIAGVGFATAAASQAPRAISIRDGSRIAGPGDTAWRLHLSYDPRRGRVLDAAITTTRQGERLDRLAVPAGTVEIADRGFPQPDGLKHTLAAGADVLVRLTWNSLRLTEPDGSPLDWAKLFEVAAAEGALDKAVRVTKARAAFEPFGMRLVLIAKASEAAARARAKARRASQMGQRRRLDPRTLGAADHMILLTSLSSEAFPVAQLGALYRLRWQIELVFKRMKSLLHIDRLPAKDPDLARAWLHAHLLFALLIDDTVSRVAALSP